MNSANLSIKSAMLYKSLSTLSQKSETVAVASPFSATVSLFCDSVDRALHVTGKVKCCRFVVQLTTQSDLRTTQACRPRVLITSPTSSTAPDL